MAGGDVPGIHEAENLAGEGVTARNQKGRPQQALGAPSHPPLEMLRGRGGSILGKTRLAERAERKDTGKWG